MSEESGATRVVVCGSIQMTGLVEEFMKLRSAGANERVEDLAVAAAASARQVRRCRVRRLEF